MLGTNQDLGSTDQGTSFADIIINNVKAVADGQISGFQSFIHDPKPLRETVEQLGKMAFPKRFIEAVTARRVATDSINSTWRCPLNLQTPLTCPIPWTIVEARQHGTMGADKVEYQIMRMIDFIGRNYIRIQLPEVDTTTIAMKQDLSTGVTPDKMTDPKQMYLGAWHRDLVPRIIDRVEFYPRSSQHKLFVYTGYDIAVHNIIFGNSNKEMNDLMAGEDKFELAYDPYRVDGTALGIASFKGIDTFKQFGLASEQTNKVDEATGLSSGMGVAYADPNGGTTVVVDDYGNEKPLLTDTTSVDGFIDSFQLDTSMDDEEFVNFYRRNVWYEAPVAVPYDCKHSIHSRRFFHRRAIILIPLDVLPFGYSIESSLPSAALAGDCGYIAITRTQNWFDRAFYLTRLSDVPSLHPIVQHMHYDEKDYVVQNAITSTGNLTTAIGLIGKKGEDPRYGWVNTRSVGKYGDPSFVVGAQTGEGAEDPNPNEEGVTTDETTMYKATKEAVVGKNIAGLEGIVPSIKQPIQVQKDKSVKYSTEFMDRHGAYGGRIKTYGSNYSKIPTSSKVSALNKLNTEENAIFLRTPQSVDPNWYNTLLNQLDIRLLQIGYMTLPSIKQLLTKLPNIYLTTEWNDYDVPITSGTKTFTINNDLYIMALLFWFIPEDSNNIPSMRVYPHHKIDTEYPVCAGVLLQNEQAQGKIVYSWDMLNLLEPAHLNLSPLLSNMGLMSFTPIMQPNCFPYSIYDQNLSGYIQCEFLKGSDTNEYPGSVNLRSGVCKTISIGINGIALLNLSMYRLVF